MKKYTEAVELFRNGTLKKDSAYSFKVSEPFIWYLDYNNKFTYVIIPKGFRTNFGSIPRLLRSIFTPTKYLAYILHDYLYSKDGVIYQDDGFYNKLYYTRKDADIILKEAIKVEGGLFIERYLIYLGVRIGGSKHYEKGKE